MLTLQFTGTHEGEAERIEVMGQYKHMAAVTSEEAAIGGGSAAEVQTFCFLLPLCFCFCLSAISISKGHSR